MSEQTRDAVLDQIAVEKAAAVHPTVFPSRHISVLLVDPRRWTQEALVRAFEAAGRDLRVQSFDEPAGLAQVEPRGARAVVLLNVTGLPTSDERVDVAVETVRSLLPDLPIAVLSDSMQVSDIVTAIKLGVRGYMPMSLSLKCAVEVLRFVAIGGTYVPADAIFSPTNISPPPPTLPSAAPPLRLRPLTMDELTPRETAVLRCLREGRSNKLIARELDMREATVKVHVRHLMRKLGAHNRTQAALLAEDVDRILL